MNYRESTDEAKVPFLLLKNLCNSRLYQPIFAI